VTDLIGCSVFELAASASPVSSSPCSLAEAPALLGKCATLFPGEGQHGTPLAGSGYLALVMNTCASCAGNICTTIEIAARRIEVRLPEGLRDL